jgi:putative intracellular protease/amidase
MTTLSAVLGIALAVLAAVGVFAIAAGAIGREARRLDALPPRKSFVLDDAVAYVGDHLSPEITATLSYADVRAVVLAQLDVLEARGVVFETNTDDDVVVDDRLVDDVTAIVRAEAPELHRDTVRAVLDTLFGYYAAIGAVGPVAEGPVAES